MQVSEVIQHKYMPNKQTMAPAKCAGESRRNNAVTPKRKKRSTCKSGIPDFLPTVTPIQALKAARRMQEEEARIYLMLHGASQGWGDTAILEIANDPFIALSVGRYFQMASELKEFNFGHWEAIVTTTHRICSRAPQDDTTAGSEILRELLTKWKARRDQRLVLLLVGQTMWTNMVAQTEAEKVQTSVN